MKYKITEGSTIYLAGVANYNTSKKNEEKKPKETKIEFNFVNDLDIDTDALKEELKKIKIIAKDEAKKAVENLKVYAKQYSTTESPKAEEDGAESVEEEPSVDVEVEIEVNVDAEPVEDDSLEDEFTAEPENEPESSEEINDKEKTYSEEPDFMAGFSDAMKNFGVHMEHFGKNFEKNMEHFGKNIEKNMGTWAKSFEKGMGNFEKNMERFGEEMERFGEEMEKNGEKWGKNLEENLKSMGKNFEKHWTCDQDSEAYETWEAEALFNELYNNSEALQALDQSPDRYFKVENYELGTKLGDQMTFVGCQVKSVDSLPNQFVSQSLKADQWLIVKLSKEEYNKDWMSKLQELEQLKDYNMETYFIVRQFKKQEVQDEKKIKLYIPLKSKES